MIMMCQCKLILDNKCTILVNDVANGGGNTCVREMGMWKISVPSFQLCCELKTVLKNNDRRLSLLRRWSTGIFPYSFHLLELKSLDIYVKQTKQYSEQWGELNRLARDHEIQGMTRF